MCVRPALEQNTDFKKKKQKLLETQENKCIH